MEEIEDIVGEVQYTDSQKSVAVSNVYSLDFTDSSSEKHNSSGRETYVIEWDDSEDSELVNANSVVSITNRAVAVTQTSNTASGETLKLNRASTNSRSRCIIAQETFTQTSKTIIELAEETVYDRLRNSKTLETQTSLISITENKTVNYTVEISESNSLVSRNETNLQSYAYNQIFTNSLEDRSSKFPVSETEIEKSDCFYSSEISSEDKLIEAINNGTKDLPSDNRNEEHYENTSDFDSSGSDIEDDSLMENIGRKINSQNSVSDIAETPKSVDNEVAELYSKLSETIDMYTVPRIEPFEPDKAPFGILTPLTEESTIRKESLVDITPIIETNKDDEKDVLFTNNAGIKVKVLPQEPQTNLFKLPPIQNNQLTSNPNLYFHFSLNRGNLSDKTNTLPSVVERENVSNRWEIETNILASGESALITGRNVSEITRMHDAFLLPPIHCEGPVLDDVPITQASHIRPGSVLPEPKRSPISIKDRIKELKMNSKSRHRNHSKYNLTHESRSDSASTASPVDSRICEVGERGCDALCLEQLKRLRSQCWFEVSDTLMDLPHALEKFWCVISENRIADLIRQVSAHVESPRTQVARHACTTLAAIIKNTNYTKKPDFNEAMTILLAKTGSFSRPVRRAANVALDEVVCGVELSPAIAALCIHGVGHKSALVRCASARLLVVCCALGGGGRDLLRARPPSAATARRLALRALAELLQDKNTDARKYAERLYSMLRPQANFEAYYLTDVDVDVATKQMKKYDQLLCRSDDQPR